MTSEDAVKRLEPALRRDSSGVYHFACAKALVSVKLAGDPVCRRFAAKDHVTFRADRQALIVEHLETGATRHQFPWEKIETIAAGEPETDSGSLFQG